jgi:hypothetical protein
MDETYAVTGAGATQGLKITANSGEVVNVASSEANDN